MLTVLDMRSSFLAPLVECLVAMTKEADCGGWRVGHRYAQTHSAMWLLFEQGCVQVAAGAPFAVGAGGCCGLACGQDPAMSDARPHRRLRLPRLRSWSRSPRVLGGFAGNGHRFCHGSWTSGRFPAGFVRCWLRRPGKTPACCGASGRFGLRNRPEVAGGVRSC